MTPDTITTLGQQAMVVTIKLSAPILLLILVVGLLIAMFQAATQINETTLSFVPKLLAVGALMIFAGHWMIEVLMDYTENLFRSIPSLIG